MMARKLKKSKVSICVFCEGESEQAYTDFLKSKFQDVAVFKRPSSTGLFDDADSRFKKDPKYRDYADVIDEIWFFFDVEEKDVDNLSKRLEIIKRLRRLRKKPQIRVRLLMTTGCIEYWLMLHYRLFAPPVLTVPEKEQMLRQVIKEEPTYKKGNYIATARIAQHYPTAVKNAGIVLQNLLKEGMPGLEDTDERNLWLCKNCRTFSTVQEAISFLESLKCE
jgi:hypothetical protein